MPIYVPNDLYNSGQSGCFVFDCLMVGRVHGYYLAFDVSRFLLDFCLIA